MEIAHIASHNYLIYVILPLLISYCNLLNTILFFPGYP